MEKSSGISLDFSLIIQKNRRFSSRTALPIFRDIVEGVHYLHENGVLHRDLKLDNLLLESERCKIIDFGFSA